MGFHRTEMAIKAFADKLTRKIEMFGKDFEGYKDETEADDLPAPMQSNTKTNVAK